MASLASQYAAFMFLPMGVNILMSTYFTAVDKPLESMIVAVSRSLVFIVIGLFLLPSFMGLDGVWMTLPFNEFTTLVVSLGLFYVYSKAVASKEDEGAEPLTKVSHAKAV